MTTSILSQTNDLTNQTLHKLITTYNAPVFVKKATFEDVTGNTAKPLPKRAFAHPSAQEFPFHTAAATWVSMAALLEKKADLDQVLYNNIYDKIVGAAEFHGITPDITALIKVSADKRPFNEDELSDSDFGLIFTENGQKERHFRMCNAQEVKIAAEYLQERRDQIPFEYRQKIAEKIIDKANEYHVNLGKLDEFVEKQAGIGFCSAKDAADLIWNRVRVIGRTDKPNETQIELAKMAKTILSKPELTEHPHSLQKIAQIIDTVDRTHFLINDYGEHLPRPEDVLFTVNTKTASEVAASHVSTITGNLYKKSDFENIKLQDVQDIMGSDFADAVSLGGLYVDPEKVAEIAPTLPLGDATLFDRMLDVCGVKPYAKQASCEVDQLDREALVELAKVHHDHLFEDVEKKAEEPVNQNRGMAIASLVQSLKQKVQR
jgi:hypothetical protein